MIAVRSPGSALDHFAAGPHEHLTLCGRVSAMRPPLLGRDAKVCKRCKAACREINATSKEREQKMSNNTAPAVDQTVEDMMLATPGLILSEAEQVSQEIAGRILGAPSVADVLAPQLTTPAEDVVNHPLTLTGVKWLESTLSPRARRSTRW